MISRSLIALSLAFSFAAFPVQAHDGKHGAKAAAASPETVAGSKNVRTSPAEEERARHYFTNLPVVTHDGKTLRFYSDVLKGRVVLVNMFYTACKDACPLINQHLAYVQKQLGDRLGKDIFFVSLTVDPETDTPAVLAKYRKNYDAGDGWLFLTGEKKNIDMISRRLGHVYSKEEHFSGLLLGNVKTAHWQKSRANVPQAAIVQKLLMLAEEK